MGHQIACRDFVEIGYLAGNLALVAYAPDAAVSLVALWVGAREFVVGDDLVVPIGDIEAAVRSEFHIYGTEPIVFRFEQIG